MKKVLGIFALAVSLMLTTGMASATAFDVDKDVTVTGDWEWDSGWNQGEFATANYGFDATSPEATSAGYEEEERSVGTPWEYGLNMNLGANSAGDTSTDLDIRTVNDPETTPATGGYTQYRFYQESHGDFTHSSLNVEGEGQITVDTSTSFDSGFSQQNFLNINDGW